MSNPDKSGKFKKMAKVREKSGNFRIRRNFKIVKERQQVAMAVSSRNVTSMDVFVIVSH